MPVYVGVDFHVKSQTVCWVDTADGEMHERTIDHERGDVAAFYDQWTAPVTVGIEALGYAGWFHRLVEQRGHRLLVGDAYAIRQFARRRQKNDRRDAELILDLLRRGDFPAVHRPSAASREVLDLLHHRERLVGMRTRLKNSLHAVALNNGLARHRALFTVRGRAALVDLPLSAAEDWLRRVSLELLDQMGERVAALDRELERRAAADARVQRLRTHPGVGRLTALAVVHTLSPATRFRHSRQVAAYCGLDPTEYSSGERIHHGRISKQGNRLLRALLVEASWSAIRHCDELRRFYFHLAAHKSSGVAIVAVARKLAVRLYRLLRDDIDYEEFRRRGRDARRARPVDEAVKA
jgi:transposase